MSEERELSPAAPQLSLTLGSTVTKFTPPNASGTFSFSTPFTFGTPFAFIASISGNAQAPFLMANAASSANLEGRVMLTGFSYLPEGMKNKLSMFRRRCQGR
jgi:hypothetical protein